MSGPDKHYPTFLKRLAAYLDRNYLRRSLPHGIINWRYLLPNPPERVRIHRRIWLMGRQPRLPLVLYLLLEVFLWLRWIGFAGWRRSWLAVKRRSADVQARERISRAEQLIRVLSISLGYCIPPAEIYNFGICRRRSRRTVWDYVFRHEVPAFHRWRNIRLAGGGASEAILNDKIRTAELLSERGVPMTPVLGFLPRGGVFDPDVYLKTCPRLFCKPRHGSAGRDNFIIERENGNERGLYFLKDGNALKAVAAESLMQAIDRDDFLIQPCLENHPFLAGLGQGADVITLRLITERCYRQGLSIYSVALEIPSNLEGSGPGYIVFPVDMSSGLVEPFPRGCLPSRAQACHDALCERMGCLTVPFWDQMKHSAMTAHGCFPEVYAIAWDFVMTPTGPLLLEGNTGWGAEAPQITHGGLLK